MFKLKPGNVFQKINTMDKKQAYTWGAVVVVCIIALITLASFLGDAEDTSFDGFDTRGYDLAQMPFVNDEAEEYLLASKYPDMQNNGAAMLYSQEEKEARQEADAEAEASEESADSDSAYSSGGYTSRGYSGRGGGAGGGSPTQVGSLGSASMGRAGGSGVSSTFGAPRGDFSPYKSQEKGSEIQYQLKNADAQKALSQFARSSRAAAGLKDNRNANAKRALMGGGIKGSEAFTDSGVDMSKASGLNLDTNAPVSSADLSNLDQAVSDAANKGGDDKKNFLNNLNNETSFWEQLGQNLLNAGVQIGLNYAMDSLANLQANRAGNKAIDGMSADKFTADLQDKFPDAFKDGGALAGKDLKQMTISDAYDLAYGESSAKYTSLTSNGGSVPSGMEPPTSYKDWRSDVKKAWEQYPEAHEVYTKRRAESYDNNFWATQGSVITQAFSGAVNGGSNGGVTAAPVKRNSRSSQSTSSQSTSSRADCISACKDYEDQTACFNLCMGKK